MAVVRYIKLCSMCTKTCIEPRSLRCFHSFCLQCLLQSIKVDNIKSVEELSCPLCKKEYIYRPMKDDEYSPLSKDTTLCSLCSKEKGNPTCKVLLATSYCVECEKEMCEHCNKEHSGQTSSKTHSVLSMGRQNSDDKEELAKDKWYNCVKHPKKQVQLYCKRCKTVICITCFTETHKFHDCIDLDKYRDQLRDQIEKSNKDATVYLKSCNIMKDQLETVTREFHGSADEVQAKIDERCEELKKMIDRHAQKLHEEVERTRERKQKQISEQSEPLDKLIIDLPTFRAYCSELASRGPSIEITRDIAGIDDRKNGLQRLQEKRTGRKLRSMKVFFKPKKLNNYGQYVDNIVGSVEGKIIIFRPTNISINSSCLC